jgi:hypothetical protein
MDPAAFNAVRDEIERRVMGLLATLRADTVAPPG